MNSISNSHKHLVLPKWLSTSSELIHRESEIPRTHPIEINTKTLKCLQEDYADFLDKPSALSATDLMGAAFVLGDKNIARETAQFVNEKKGVPEIASNLSLFILNKHDEKTVSQATYTKISSIRNRLRIFPKNPLNWIELARLYTSLGLINKARRAVQIALNISPACSFIVRSSARFFIHIGEPDVAFHYTKQAVNEISDPWIDATHANVEILLKKQPKRILKSVKSKALYSSDYMYSELFETYAFLELECGNERKAKKVFKQAWIDPSVNVVTHGEWVIRNFFPNLAETSNLDLKKSHEADAWDSYWNLNLSKSIHISEEWGSDEPYSPHPWILGSYVSCLIGEYKKAIEIAKTGLLANSSDFNLNNNLIFSLIKTNNIDEAEKRIKDLVYKNQIDKIVYLATRGLLEYKKNNFDSGKEFYMTAIDLCESVEDGRNRERLRVKALLNLAIAETEANGCDAQIISERAEKLASMHTDPDVLIIKEKLLEVRKLQGHQ